MLKVSADTAAIARLSQSLTAFGPKLPNAQALVINRVMTRTRAQVIPALAIQTGLNKKIITKAVHIVRASPATPRGLITARGGDISLRYFGAHEVKGGVEATVRGEALRLQGHYFRRSGRNPRFMVRKLNRQVFFSSSGKWGVGEDLEVKKSGVFIGVDLVDGATKQAFLDVIDRDLPLEIAAELAKLLPGG